MFLSLSLARFYFGCLLFILLALVTAKTLYFSQFYHFFISFFLSLRVYPVSVSVTDEFAHFTLVYWFRCCQHEMCIIIRGRVNSALSLCYHLRLANFIPRHWSRVGGASMVQMKWQWKILAVVVAATTVIENRITGIEEWAGNTREHST